mgnify:CR=1 FL=1
MNAKWVGARQRLQKLADRERGHLALIGCAEGILEVGLLLMGLGFRQQGGNPSLTKGKLQPFAHGKEADAFGVHAIALLSRFPYLAVSLAKALSVISL